MSNSHRAPLHIHALHRHSPEAPESAVYEPVASYDQMFEFLVKLRSMLAAPSFDNVNYILANQESVHDIKVFISGLIERYNLATLNCNQAQTQSEEVACKFQQAWDLVDVRANAIATQSRYVNTVSQELGEVWRTHDSPPNKHWTIVCISLATELKEAVGDRQQMLSDLEDAEKRAECWEPRFILAIDKWRNDYQDAMQLHEAFKAIHTEFLAVRSLATIFSRKIQRFGHRISCGSESERLWRMNQALMREEEMETKVYGAMSRSKKHLRGS